MMHNIPVLIWNVLICQLRALSSKFLLQRYKFSIFEGASAQFELFTENIKYF